MKKQPFHESCLGLALIMITTIVVGSYIIAIIQQALEH